jgi:hypothetical protein
MFPQPSESAPHCAPCAAQVVGVHSHLLGVPFAAHVKGAAQVPQSRLPPQPSGATPHSAPRPRQVFGVQPQTFS